MTLQSQSKLHIANGTVEQGKEARPVRTKPAGWAGAKLWSRKLHWLPGVLTTQCFQQLHQTNILTRTWQLSTLPFHLASLFPSKHLTQAMWCSIKAQCKIPFSSSFLRQAILGSSSWSRTSYVTQDNLKLGLFLPPKYVPPISGLPELVWGQFIDGIIKNQIFLHYRAMGRSKKKKKNPNRAYLSKF